jgi:hypothetical protein
MTRLRDGSWCSYPGRPRGDGLDLPYGRRDRRSNATADREESAEGIVAL